MQKNCGAGSKDIQAILVPEFTFLTKFSDKRNFKKGMGILIGTRKKFENLAKPPRSIFTRERSVENFIKIEAS